MVGAETRDLFLVVGEPRVELRGVLVAELGFALRHHALTPLPPLAEARPELEAKPELEAVVRKALAKKPKDRFPNAHEMQRAMRAVKPPAARLVM